MGLEISEINILEAAHRANIDQLKTVYKADIINFAEDICQYLDAVERCSEFTTAKDWGWWKGMRNHITDRAKEWIA